MKNNNSIILGIDPGLATTGYGVIQKEKNGDFKMICNGIIATAAKQIFAERLKGIHQQLNKIIKKYKPGKVAVEELFFCKNVKTALSVGHARGVIILTASQNGLPVFEYTPLQIKQAVASYGRADKKQVQSMVKILLNLKNVPKPDDAADALAIAICCGNSDSAVFARS
ncbi:crossover junction endodeoxyribonuclease RuvC [Candidatus Parcubacteria bacterium]|nr:crossover junction endodeoxyribonuclease RuvC [Candidatus Parcubacteria bacterium]